MAPAAGAPFGAGRAEMAVMKSVIWIPEDAQRRAETSGGYIRHRGPQSGEEAERRRNTPQVRLLPYLRYTASGETAAVGQHYLQVRSVSVLP